MDTKLEKTLVKKYPVIFQDYRGDMRQTCMAWGMECGDGWFELIDNMCANITKVIGNKSYKVIANQVKEKFGGLRFYYSIEHDPNFLRKNNYIFRNWMFKKRLGHIYWKIINFRKKFYKTTSEKIEAIIEEAEHNSYKTCETCGQPGKPRGGGWIYTACDECEKRFQEKKSARLYANK
jgi:hypothetical protein